jgi:two-component system, OmpR family, response regulator
VDKILKKSYNKISLSARVKIIMSKKIEKPVIYSALEVANICGVVNQTAINWINNGYLKAFKTPGGQYRVYPDDLVDFMSGRNMHIPLKLLSACTNRTAYNSGTVLVIDDDKTFNTLIAGFISNNFPSFEVIQAYDGFDAGVQISSKHPRCIILDLDLPGINGFELCRKINENREYGKPAIIVVTALQSAEDEKKIEEEGIVKFFRKPLKLDELREVIDVVFKD